MRLQKTCCGWPLQSACIVTVCAEAIVAVLLTISLILYEDSVAPWIILPFAGLDLLLVALVVIGATIQKHSLMWPYLIVKIAVIGISAIATVVCTLYVLFGSSSRTRRYEVISEEGLRTASIVIGPISLFLVGMNIVPTTVVRNFQKHLIDDEQPERNDINYRFV